MEPFCQFFRIQFWTGIFIKFQEFNNITNDLGKNEFFTS